MDMMLSEVADWQAAALQSACKELHNCLALAARQRAPGDMLLANLARERLVGLVLSHGAEKASDLLISDGPFSETFEDRHLVATLLDLPALTRSFKQRGMLSTSDPRFFVSGLLICRPQDLEGLDRWLADPACSDILIHYVSWQPKCFDADADRQRYLVYATNLCNQCATLLGENPMPPLARLLAHFVGSLRSGVIYSCEGSLRPFAEAKSRLLTTFTAQLFPDLATLPPLSPLPRDGRSIRFGILWNDVEWRTENTVGVAAAKDLRAYGFHVISILNRLNYHEGAGDRQTIMDDISAASDEIVDLSALSELPTIEEKALAIRALNLDVLFFMNNVTFGFNDYVALATLRLARYQGVNQSAVFTTGFPTIDFYVSGELSERSADPQWAYTERLVRVPGTCLVFDRRHVQEPTNARAITSSLREPMTTTLFTSGANLYKIHPLLSLTWARILGRTPGSRLVLYPFNPNWDLSYPVDRFLRRFNSQLLAEGVDPERVTIAGPWRDAAAVGELLLAADILLDSFPHSGGLSSLDALKLGVPVVTCSGEMQRENQTADLLDLIGLSRFVTATIEDYANMACRLAQDPDYLAEYRAGLLKGIDDAPFYDLDKFSRVFATALQEILVDG